MAEKLDNIFNECLDRIAQGESIESCLRSYPREAAQLEPLLRTAFGFNWRASAIEPRPEFKAWARAQIHFQAAQLYATRAMQPQRTGLFTWQRAWVVALTAILLFVLTGAGTVAASSNALPDQPLYPVKLATEDIRLVLATSNVEKAQVHTQLAENRAMEIATMARQGKTDQVVATTDRMVKHLEEADVAFAVVEQQASAETLQLAATAVEATPVPAPTAEPTQPTDTPAEVTPAPTTTEPPSSVKTTEPDKTTRQREKADKLNQAMTKSTSRSLAALQKALEEAPPEAKPALQRAIKNLTEKEGKRLLHKPSAENQHQEQEQEQEQNQEQNQDQEQNQNQKQNQNQNQNRNSAPVIEKSPTQEPGQNQEPGKTIWDQYHIRNQTSVQQPVQKTINHIDNKADNRTETIK